ncbi:MAG: hypothetical protein ACRCUE_11810 [Bosea sp. (in: a-proteobacteria)]
MKFMSFVAATLATLVLAVPALAQAQRAQRPPAEITVINARTVAMTAFEIATTGEQPRLVGKLSAPLAPGKSAKLKLTRPTGCTFYVLARFEDESENDSDSANLCGEKQIRLTD